MKKLSFHHIIGLLFVLFAIGWNLWTYRYEPTASIDPNDNTFQYALVDRTNQILDFANKTCSSYYLSFGICHLAFLTDHWVPNWAQGYNLPYYYSHMPQIAIVLSWRFFDWIIGLLDYSFIGLFSYYHWITYLLLCLFPLSLYLSLVSIGLSPFSAGIGAIIASHVSTDGLYGLDPASFLWRGYGLSSQLFAMIWLPLALAFAYRGRIVPAIVFLTATTAGHLGIGIIAFMSAAILGWKHPKKLLLTYAGVLLFLAYWIIPILLHGDYHNISFWDPVWKFDSYGAKEVIIRLLNGDLFDFGRLPILTWLTLLGAYAALQERFKIYDVRFKKNTQESESSFLNPKSYVLHPFAFLFAFWLLMYFGRSTWGGLIDLIPGMADFHLSRFIVGVHIAGLFLIPIGVEWTLDRFRIKDLGFKRNSLIYVLVYGLIGVLVYWSISAQTTRYASYNDVLIKQANDNYAKQSSDAESLILNLKSLISVNPGRVFAGRGGSWGKDFRVAETPYYMYLSTYGIPTVLWLPQTWSPNSDTEQYFSEDQLKDYVLYNIRYVVTPLDQKPQPFWNLIKESPSWKLYEVETDGYVTTGIRPATVSVDKQNFINVVRLWIQSQYHVHHLYPELTFDASYPKPTGLPNFKMIDEATYKVPDGSTHSLFQNIPRYQALDSELLTPTILSQESDGDMVFRATVEVPENCMQCLVILRQTAHPSWQATVNGEPVEPITVFPFYSAILLTEPGKHDIIFTYSPSGTKKSLLFLSITLIACILFLTVRENSKLKIFS